MTRLWKSCFGWIVAVGLLAWGAHPANAAFVLTLDDLATPGLDVIVVDDVNETVSGSIGTPTRLGAATNLDMNRQDVAPFDSTLGDGNLMWSGPVGSFITTMSFGLSNPVIGGINVQKLRLTSVEVSGGAGTLLIKLTDTDFERLYTIDPVPVIHRVGGVTDGTVSFVGEVDFQNNEFGLDASLNNVNDIQVSSGPFTGAFSDAQYPVFPGLSIPAHTPFSMTETATITHTAAGQITSFDAEITVPEASSLIIWSLLGAIGVAIGWWRRRQS